MNVNRDIDAPIPAAVRPVFVPGYRSILLTLAGGALLIAGLAGALTAAWGYALFVAAAVLLATGLVLFALFAMTRVAAPRAFRKASASLLAAGGYVYVLAVCAMSGYYVHEALAGRVEWQWMLFGPSAL